MSITKTVPGDNWDFFSADQTWSKDDVMEIIKWQFPGVNPPKEETPFDDLGLNLFLTGSQFYGTAKEESDHDYFGTVEAVGTALMWFVQNNWTILPGEYHRSFYVKKGNANINLICLKGNGLGKWFAATETVNLLLKKYPMVKPTYLKIFESVCSTFDPISFGAAVRRFNGMDSWPKLSMYDIMSIAI